MARTRTTPQIQKAGVWHDGSATVVCTAGARVRTGGGTLRYKRWSPPLIHPQHNERDVGQLDSPLACRWRRCVHVPRTRACARADLPLPHLQVGAFQLGWCRERACGVSSHVFCLLRSPRSRAKVPATAYIAAHSL